MRTHKRGVLGGGRGRGAAKPSKGSGHLTQERVSRGTGVWGARGSVPQTCTRELGGLGGSSPAPWPRRLRHMAYLTPPPSSQQRRRRRERERVEIFCFEISSANYPIAFFTLLLFSL